MKSWICKTVLKSYINNFEGNLLLSHPKIALTLPKTVASCHQLVSNASTCTVETTDDICHGVSTCRDSLVSQVSLASCSSSYYSEMSDISAILTSGCLYMKSAECVIWEAGGYRKTPAIFTTVLLLASPHILVTNRSSASRIDRPTLILQQHCCPFTFSPTDQMLHCSLRRRLDLFVDCGNS